MRRQRVGREDEEGEDPENSWSTLTKGLHRGQHKHKKTSWTIKKDLIRKGWLQRQEPTTGHDTKRPGMVETVLHQLRSRAGSGQNLSVRRENVPQVTLYERRQGGYKHQSAHSSNHCASLHAIYKASLIIQNVSFPNIWSISPSPSKWNLPAFFGLHRSYGLLRSYSLLIK